MLFISSFLIGCSVLPIKAKVKDNHFRLENLKRDKWSPFEHVYLMCFNKRATSWNTPKQYQSGEHDLWVKATISDRSISNRGLPNSYKEAFVNFKVKLDSGISYMINRKIIEDNIAVWIQEVDTGRTVSEVLITKFEYPLPSVKDYKLSKKRCESGSI
jgi:hypothetical protein